MDVSVSAVFGNEASFCGLRQSHPAKEREREREKAREGESEKGREGEREGMRER